MAVTKTAASTAAAAQLERAQTLSKTQPKEAFDILNALVRLDVDMKDEESVRIKEQSIIELGKLLSRGKHVLELQELIKFSRPFLNMISKAKAGTLVRALVDYYLDMNMDTVSEIELCRECIEWAKNEKRTYLRQALEARLLNLYYDKSRYQEALQLASVLLKELKKVDDKQLLVDVQLIESKTFFALGNLPKSRAALVTARTTANAIYCPPRMQGQLDLQSGIIHAAEDVDFRTAYSYFYESFEGFDGIDDKRAITALKYMLLSKIMLNSPEDVNIIVDGKLALKYVGKDVEALKAVARASSDRSLSDFQKALETFKEQLVDDPIIRSHLDNLYQMMLEQNLTRIIEPYSRVQIDHISKLINLDQQIVEKKLSQMILDKVLPGILDQGQGVIVLYEDNPVDKTYEAALGSVGHFNKALDQLFQRAKKLS
ncbi:26S proteasome non-ATPase regulatory subunit 11A-like [Paramacrobiotus metropolitanus]|uniref:26S proteasome non-ATPase regulatory subunit 11A-like n=1 Tax=Paramacrobiotus metropolitanus TaxID=2943436 RepID=UPI002445A5C4|nr:26S proteasome non-ATPase regulatory subunit 11A-like [Paramacrobiotus metropolitanus]XP_055333245.1 26S proteasome non-ATPase regulatory subunit 11A-like [Paramacrobiotus metropolitanus]